MKTPLFTLLLLLVLPQWSSAEAGSAGGRYPLKVVTFNLHYLSLRNPELLNWSERREAAAAVLGEANADIIALQETETFAGGDRNDRNIQLEYLLSRLPAYEATAVGNPARYPSTQPVLIRRGRFDLREQGFFFFSPEPDRIYSRSWDGRFPAFASWVELFDRRWEESFYLYNVHLDAGSVSNRRRSAELIARRIIGRPKPELPVLLAGDFNALRWFPVMRTLRSAGLEIAPSAGSTFHFNRGLNLFGAIDHLLYSEEFAHRESRVLRSSYGGVYPSDHYPLAVLFGPGE